METEPGALASLENDENHTNFPSADFKVECVFKKRLYSIGLFRTEVENVFMATSAHRLRLDEQKHWREAETNEDLGVDLQKAMQTLLDCTEYPEEEH